MRRLQNGTEVPELDTAVTITVYTKCPTKYMLIDQETGEAYVPYESTGTLTWKKIGQGNIELDWK
jgi:hypothetical protein